MAVAQEEEEKKKFEFSGTVDAYYRANFNGLNKEIPALDTNGDVIGNFIPAAPGTSFANDPGFALGMVNLVAAYEGDKVGFVADLVLDLGVKTQCSTLLALQQL